MSIGNCASNDAGNDAGSDVGDDIGKDVGNCAGNNAGDDVGNDVGNGIGIGDGIGNSFGNSFGNGVSNGFGNGVSRSIKGGGRGLGPAAATLVPAVELGPSSGVLALVESRAGTRWGHCIGLAVNIEGHTWSIKHGAIQNGTGDWNGDDVGEQAKLQGKRGDQGQQGPY
jgi:hypothetical protein